LKTNGLNHRREFYKTQREGGHCFNEKRRHTKAASSDVTKHFTATIAMRHCNGSSAFQTTSRLCQCAISILFVSQANTCTIFVALNEKISSDSSWIANTKYLGMQRDDLQRFIRLVPASPQSRAENYAQVHQYSDLT
jgi:hypothetical protein